MSSIPRLLLFLIVFQPVFNAQAIDCHNNCGVPSPPVAPYKDGPLISTLDFTTNPKTGEPQLRCWVSTRLYGGTSWGVCPGSLCNGASGMSCCALIGVQKLMRLPRCNGPTAKKKDKGLDKVDYYQLRAEPIDAAK